MKKSIKNVAVLFSLAFALVLTVGFHTIPSVDTNEGISVCSNLWNNNSVED